MSNRFYAGIGARKTPIAVQEQMTAIAVQCEYVNLTLRSGGATGADLAFENGVVEKKEIFLPWKRFNQNPSELYPPTEDAKRIAREIHPVYDKLSIDVKLFISRNVHQILGRSLDEPVDFVVCYTLDGAETLNETSAKTGGTGTAIRLASMLNIPVFNLGKDYYRKIEFEEFFEEKYLSEWIKH